MADILLFLLIAGVLHPSVGLVDASREVQPNWVHFLGAMAVLQPLTVLFNLLPVPPLDGFGIISPYLGREVRRAARRLGWGGLIVVYLLLMYVEPVSQGWVDAVDHVLRWIGLPYEVTWDSYRLALWGHGAS